VSLALPSVGALKTGLCSFWEDKILSAKTCDVIKRGFPRLQGRHCSGGLLVRAMHYKERSSSAILVKNKVFLQNHGLNELLKTII
jgi:hypothetical protein